MKCFCILHSQKTMSPSISTTTLMGSMTSSQLSFLMSDFGQVMCTQSLILKLFFRLVPHNSDYIFSTSFFFARCLLYNSFAIFWCLLPQYCPVVQPQVAQEHECDTSVQGIVQVV